jgi:polyisoprenoid-binding protein YceI
MSPETHNETKATRWRLDPAQSTAQFRVPHFWGLVKVSGHFDSLDGWLEIDNDGTGRLELTIDAASLTTGNRQRDQHLRSADFFDTDRHPALRFCATLVSDAGDGHLSVVGELRAAGRQVTLALQPILRQVGDRLHVDASITVDQRALGMTWSPLGMTRTPTTLTVQAQLHRDS